MTSADSASPGANATHTFSLHGQSEHHVINFVVALPAEASPVVKRWRLKKSNRQHPFSLFTGDDLRLVVSGIGKCNSAAATSWLAGINSRYRQRNSIWVNIGLAGHRTLTTGTLVTASRIRDASTDQNWYPTLIKNPLAKVCINTVDQPVFEYETDYALDMEASGFFPAAIKITTSELAQCYKVISDNPDNPATNITPEYARSIVGDNLPAIEKQLDQLKQLSGESEIVDSSEIEALFHSKWKFSETQKNRLQRQLHRQFALSGDYEKARKLLDDCRTKKWKTQDLLNVMESILAAAD